MPLPDDASRLRHILDSSRTAVRFATGKTGDDLLTDEMLFLALTRLLEIIGEAAAGVSPEFQSEHAEIPWRQMSAMRNRLIRGYFDVNRRLVWETVATDLPSVIRQVQAAIERKAF